MSFKLLQEAITADSFDNEITKSDYNSWLRAIKAEGEDQGINLNTRRNFDNVAFELLDNDPKMDMIGGHEASKRKIVNALWHMCQAADAGEKALRSASRATKKVAREEEEVGQLYPGERGMGNVVKQPTKMHSSFQAVISDGFAKGKSISDPAKAKKVKNPYSAGSARAKLWQKSFNRGHQQCLDKMHKAREEEESSFDSLGAIKREGFIACAQAYAEQDEFDDQPLELINPYDEGTDEAAAFEEGWNDCEEQMSTYDGENSVDDMAETEFDLEADNEGDHERDNEFGEEDPNNFEAEPFEDTPDEFEHDGERVKFENEEHTRVKRMKRPSPSRVIRKRF